MKEEKKLNREIKGLNFLNSILNKPIIELLLLTGLGYSFLTIPANATIVPEHAAMLIGGAALGVVAHVTAYIQVSKKLAELENRAHVIEVEKNRRVVYEDDETRRLNEELEKSLALGVTAKSNQYNGVPAPTVESTLYNGEIAEESMDDWRLYLATQSMNKQDFNTILYRCLEELNEGISFDELIDLIAEFVSAENVVSLIYLLVEFSPRGQDLEEYWNNRFPEHKIENTQRKRTK